MMMRIMRVQPAERTRVEPLLLPVASKNSFVVILVCIIGCHAFGPSVTRTANLQRGYKSRASSFDSFLNPSSGRIEECKSLLERQAIFLVDAEEEELLASSRDYNSNNSNGDVDENSEVVELDGNTYQPSPPDSWVVREVDSPSPPSRRRRRLRNGRRIRNGYGRKRSVIKQKASRLLRKVKKRRVHRHHEDIDLTTIPPQEDVSIVKNEKQVLKSKPKSKARLRPKKSRRKKAKLVPVSNVYELREAVLNKGVPFKSIDYIRPTSPATSTATATANNDSLQTTTADSTEAASLQPELTQEQLQQHQVLKLIAHRVRTKSTPSHRHSDSTYSPNTTHTTPLKLALAIEGGGMRGAVSAGMAAAIATLGLTDAFDVIYGSSAGNIVGAYMISRQMCVDVYTEVLPAAKKRFVCKSRLLKSLLKLFVKEKVGRRVEDWFGAFYGGAAGFTKAGSEEEEVLAALLLEDDQMAIHQRADANTDSNTVTDMDTDMDEDIDITTPNHQQVSPWQTPISSPSPSSLALSSTLFHTEDFEGTMRKRFQKRIQLRMLFFLRWTLAILRRRRLLRLDAYDANDGNARLVNGDLSVSGYNSTTPEFDTTSTTTTTVKTTPPPTPPPTPPLPTPLQSTKPGAMNVSFIFDGVMSPVNTAALRPLDMVHFQHNDAKQPLRVVTSAVDSEGEMETVVFGSREGDFFGLHDDDNNKDEEGKGREEAGMVHWVWSKVWKSGLRRWWMGVKRKVVTRVMGYLHSNQNSNDSESLGHGDDYKLLPQDAMESTFMDSHQDLEDQQVTRCIKDSRYEKRGLFACMEASIMVPGATGPPMQLLRPNHVPSKDYNKMSNDNTEESSKNRIQNSKKQTTNATKLTCFDTFCYEPMPYRSAVHEGATHVVCLRTRPNKAVCGTKPGVYERHVANTFFRSQGMEQVARYMERGGQQYRYLEDVLTLEEGLKEGCYGNGGGKGIPVPPSEILYATAATDARTEPIIPEQEWNYAHLLPVTVPEGTPELSQFSQDREEVLQGVRDGYAAAFDLFAPVSGLDPKLLNGDGKGGVKLDGRRVAELVFPSQTRARKSGLDGEEEEWEEEVENARVLGAPLKVKGDAILEPPLRRKRDAVKEKWADLPWLRSRRRHLDGVKGPAHYAGGKEEDGGRLSKIRRLFQVIGGDEMMEEDGVVMGEAEMLLATLPGLQAGKFSHLASGLKMNQTMV